MLQRNIMIWMALGLCMVAAPILSSAASFESVNGQITKQAVVMPTQGSYTVHPGDTLWVLAKKLGVSVQDLMANNHIQNPHLLQIGDKLSYTIWPSLSPSGQSNNSTSNTGKPSTTTLSSRGEGLMDMPVKKVIHCTLTAYTAGYESTGKGPGDAGYDITSTGEHAIQGVTVAVDPSVIPYGTKLYIPGIGYRVAEDSGGAIIGDHIDIFYNSVATARDFGVKHDRTVYVLPDWYHIPLGG